LWILFFSICTLIIYNLNENNDKRLLSAQLIAFKILTKPEIGFHKITALKDDITSQVEILLEMTLRTRRYHLNNPTVELVFKLLKSKSSSKFSTNIIANWIAIPLKYLSPYKIKLARNILSEPTISQNLKDLANKAILDYDPQDLWTRVHKIEMPDHDKTEEIAKTFVRDIDPEYFIPEY